jgi:predicted O-methyltransferase YrrM
MNSPEPVTGPSADALSSSFCQRRPPWVQGSLSFADTRYLFRSVLACRPPLVVEVGTASGFSTALLCYALSVVNQARSNYADYKVVSYDLATSWYCDPGRRVGDAARVQLSHELLANVVFRNPATVADAKLELGHDHVQFCFIDGNHRHPWPTLDLLGLLDCLAPGAVVVFHDINLPVIHPEFADWGAKYLFDDLTIDKSFQADDDVPNIGSVTVPPDKEALRSQLLTILFAHDWQDQINERYLEQLGVSLQG